MRLTCPNCGAEYDVQDGMVPAAGRHVQCTECHTRWFATGARRKALTEDQILRRLETLSPRPRPVPVPDAAPRPEADADADVDTDADVMAEAEPIAAAPRAAAALSVVPTRAPGAGPAKPADRPTVARPAPVTDTPLPPPAARPSPRLDLGSEPAVPLPPEPEAPPRSRFLTGLLLALLLAGLALAGYLYRAPIVERVPQLAPALQAYATEVDDLRALAEAKLAPLRRAVAAE